MFSVGALESWSLAVFGAEPWRPKPLWDSVRDFLQHCPFFLFSFVCLFLCFVGLQHDVIHPTNPFGLPLEYNILPQELKKVGRTF